MMVYNEIYPAIIEKHKIIDPCKRSVFKLLEQYKEGERGALGYKSTSKAHATMKIFFFTNVFRGVSFCY